MKNLAAALLALSAGFATLPAQAWTPPSVGTACKGTRGGGPQIERIAGNYLGGRRIRDGIVDRKSFQSCFRTVERCEGWLAAKAARYPLQPGFATCTRVVLR